tara:strand:- start:30 stop:605 length:576 start_codon:yes stop_codon:yes gene_type:complete
MSPFKIIVAIIVALAVVIVAVAVNYSWVSGCPLVGRPPNVQYTFSEFEESNGTGVYVSEVLEMDRGEMYQCSSDNKVRLSSLEIYLMDNEGFTNSTWDLWSLQDNYAGNIEETVNLSSEIANDNGTIYPIHFENQMDNDFEKYNYELYLSVGDKIKVYGSGSEADGPAENGWSVRLGSGIYSITNDDLVIP